MSDLPLIMTEADGRELGVLQNRGALITDSLASDGEPSAYGCRMRLAEAHRSTARQATLNNYRIENYIAPEAKYSVAASQCGIRRSA
jgi:hypothetical protein